MALNQQEAPEDVHTGVRYVVDGDETHIYYNELRPAKPLTRFCSVEVYSWTGSRYADEVAMRLGVVAKRAEFGSINHITTFRQTILKTRTSTDLVVLVDRRNELFCTAHCYYRTEYMGVHFLCDLINASVHANPDNKDLTKRSAQISTRTD